MLVADLGVPVVGVNLGRLGFLSENRPEDVAQAILSQDYTIEDRSLLKASLSAPCGNPSIDRWPYALNEVAVHRSGAAMLGVDVCLDGKWLPTYWADGLIVSTSSGSTAYSLSVGGPIVLPQSKVLILAPIAPHNLNIRPLVIPDSSEVHLRVHSRDGKAIFTIDNRTVELPEGLEILGCDAFCDCSNLKTVVIHGNVHTIGARSFNNCSALESVVISEGVEVIEQEAFCGCYALKNLVIPESVTEIPAYFFMQATALQSIVLHAGITSIGDYAFRSCYELTEVTVYGNPTVGDYIFSSCEKLAAVKCAAGTYVESQAKAKGFNVEYIG